MKEERDIIRIDEYGRLNLPTDTAVMWMTEVEIVELFGHDCRSGACWH